MTKAPLKYVRPRIESIEGSLEALNADALLVLTPAQKGYLSGITTGIGISPSGGILMTAPGSPNIYLTSGTDYALCEEQLRGSGYDVVPHYPGKGGSLARGLARVAVDLRIRSIAVDSGSLTISLYDELCNEMKSVNVDLITTDSNIVDQLREVKDNWELEQIRKASEISCRAFERVLGMIKPGLTEWEIATELEHSIKRDGYGSHRLAFRPVVVSGARTAFPHGAPTNRRLETGDLVTIDFGATWNGYCCDITRTFGVGSVTDKQRHIYEVVARSQRLAIDQIRPGARRMDVADMALAVIKEYNLQDNIAHGPGGHGIGIEVHEGPRVRSSGTWVSGNIITVEPGLYFPGWGGVRIEDDIHITETGKERITELTRELLVI